MSFDEVIEVEGITVTMLDANQCVNSLHCEMLGGTADAAGAFVAMTGSRTFFSCL